MKPTPRREYCHHCGTVEEMIVKPEDESFHERLGCKRCDKWLNLPQVKSDRLRLHEAHLKIRQLADERRLLLHAMEELSMGRCTAGFLRTCLDKPREEKCPAHQAADVLNELDRMRAQ